MRIYCVCGTPGDYDDYDFWIFKAFKSKDEADAVAEGLNQKIHETAKMRLKHILSDDEFIDLKDNQWKALREIDSNQLCKITTVYKVLDATLEDS